MSIYSCYLFSSQRRTIVATFTPPSRRTKRCWLRGIVASRATAQTDNGTQASHPAELVSQEPYFRGRHGAAYLGDSLALLRALPPNQFNLVITSPPYALHFKKEYGNKEKKEYIDWFLPFAREIFRVLKDDGSFILNIGGSYNQGSPTRSIYHFKLLIALVEEIGFHLA